MAEPAPELPVGRLESAFGIGTQESGHVHGHEEQVAHLLQNLWRCMGFSSLTEALTRGRRCPHCLLELGDLLVELVEDGRSGGPVEAHAARLHRHLVGLHDGGKSTRDAIEERPVGLPLGLAFLPFDGLPVAQHIVGRLGFLGPEDVGVSADHLLRNAIDDVLHVEGSSPRSDVGVEHHLEKEIPELSAELVIVLLIDGEAHFVGLLDGHGLDTLVGLLGVPRTAPRCAQPCDEPNELLETAPCAHWNGLGRPRLLALFAHSGIIVRRCPCRVVPYREGPVSAYLRVLP